MTASARYRLVALVAVLFVGSVYWLVATHRAPAPTIPDLPIDAIEVVTIVGTSATARSQQSIEDFRNAFAKSRVTALSDSSPSPLRGIKWLRLWQSDNVLAEIHEFDVGEWLYYDRKAQRWFQIQGAEFDDFARRLNSGSLP